MAPAVPRDLPKVRAGPVVCPGQLGERGRAAPHLGAKDRSRAHQCGDRSPRLADPGAVPIVAEHPGEGRQDERPHDEVAGPPTPEEIHERAAALPGDDDSALVTTL